MRLLLLGTTGYHPSDHRQTACLMLPDLGVVLDAGTAMYRVRDHLRTTTLDIFLSHAHLDHVVGLTYLLDVASGKQLDRITVHGEAEKLEAVRQHLFSPLLFPVEPTFECRPLADRVPLPDGGQLTHFPLQHPGGTVGYRLDWPGHSLAYVTDTTASPDAEYVSQLRGVDLLIHECNFDDSMRHQALLTGHSHTTPVAEVARLAAAKRLVLVHVNPLADDRDPIDIEAARRVFPASDLGIDGMELEF